MPVLKLPVVHKFGIISHCQRLQLQSRLISDLRLTKSVITKNPNKNQFDITESFVQEHNAIINGSESSSREKADTKQKCHQMFLKIQRRIGLQFNCEGQPHINVALGWSELAIISQCQGDVSGKSLDLLHLSLSVAPITPSIFFVQFFLLETALYFLQMMPFRASHPDQHIKWLQIGELAALRIYIQYRCNLAFPKKEYVDNLQIYAKDLRKCHENFVTYPETSISFCVIEQVVKVLVESDDICLYYEGTTQESDSKNTFLLDHCVNLWKCAFYPSRRSQIEESARDVRQCLMHSASFGNWLDCYLSLRVLSSVASLDMVGLETFESLVLGLLIVDAEMETKNRLIETSKAGESGNTDELICGFEKGTLLLLTALREFASIPWFSRKSEEREKSLSIIAEWLLHGALHNLSSTAVKILTARLKAVLEIVDLSKSESGISAIKNAVWSLLETVERRQILKGQLEHCLKYGKIVSSLLFSRELSARPEFINEKISRTLANEIRPTNEVPLSSRSEPHVNSEAVESQKTSRLITEKTKKPEIIPTSTRKVLLNTKSSEYIRQSNIHLKNVFQKLWEAELPELERSIDDSK